MNDSDTLLACFERAGPMVHHTVGFHDDDFEQDACEAMLKATHTYEPGHGTTLSTWLLYKGKFAIVDAIRDRLGRLVDGVNPHRRDVSLDDSDAFPALLGVDDVALDAVDAAIDAHAELDHLQIERTLAEKHFGIRGREMVRRRLAGETFADIARELDCTESAVSYCFTRFRDCMIAAADAPPATGYEMSRADGLAYFTTLDQSMIADRLDGISGVDIAKRYGVFESQVSRAFSKYRLRIVTPPVVVDQGARTATLRAFTPREREIVRRREAGETNAAVSAAVGLCMTTVSRTYTKFRNEYAAARDAHPHDSN